MSYLEYKVQTVPTGARKILHANWALLLLLTAVASIGFLMLYSVAGGVSRYSASCTPGYYNSEQGQDPKAARNLVYIGSLLDYVEHLARWRDAGDLAGTRVVRAADAT